MGVRQGTYSPSYRLIYIPLVAGAILSLILLTNSFRDYIFVSRLLATQQVRHRMREYMATLDQQLKRVERRNDSRLNLLLDDVKASGERPLWIAIRYPDGSTLEQYGDSTLHVFQKEEEDNGLRKHEAVFRVVPTDDGSAVVEAFAMHQPISTIMERSPLSPATAHSLFIVELALPLTPADPSILLTQRWNLFINTSGALALLGTVLIAGVNVRSYVRGRLLEQQLEVAREVQARLLPVTTDGLDGLLTAMEYRPAEQVSGDFYDLFTVSNKRAAIVIGDVSGKGVPAALLMGVIHGAVRSTSWTGSSEQHELETSRLNTLLCQHADGNRYATMFWCYYDRPARTLHYINAGHVSPLLITSHENGAAIIPLDIGGLVIGLLPNISFSQASTPISQGDLLVMYSDGLIEATNKEGEEYGEDRLRRILAEAYGRTPAECKTVVMNSVTKFLGAGRLHDDLTIVITQFS